MNQIEIKQFISNPLLSYKLLINRNDEIINIEYNTIAKYFVNVYILCPLKSETLPVEIYSSKISETLFDELKMKLVLVKTKNYLLKNPVHYNKAVICSADFLNKFNHFGVELKEENLVVPILNIEFMELYNYLKMYEGDHYLDNLYNLIVLSKYFSVNEKNYNNASYIISLITNLEETNYWSRSWNCLSNLSKCFNKRRFNFNSVRIDENTEMGKIIKYLQNDFSQNNYLELLFKNNKNYVDASKAITKKGYKLYNICNKCKYDKNDINLLFNNLNKHQQYLLFCNLLVSKKYCHLVLNNSYILNKMKTIINDF